MNKLDNGSVIFTPEEYGDYLMLQQNYEFAVENIEKLQEISDKKTQKLIQFFKTRDEVRKETAKEIYRALLGTEHIKECVKKEYCEWWISRWRLEDLNRVFKEYGVEVEE